MACKTCKNESVADPYDCHRCVIKNKNYSWVVMTKVPPTCQADDIVEMTREEAKYFVTRGCHGDLAWMLGEWRQMRAQLTKIEKDKYFFRTRFQVFQEGEIFAVDNDFERELTGMMRKPSKWFVEYETFPADQLEQAMLRAREISEGPHNG